MVRAHARASPARGRVGTRAQSSADAGRKRACGRRSLRRRCGAGSQRTARTRWDGYSSRAHACKRRCANRPARLRAGRAAFASALEPPGHSRGRAHAACGEREHRRCARGVLPENFPDGKRGLHQQRAFRSVRQEQSHVELRAAVVGADLSRRPSQGGPRRRARRSRDCARALRAGDSDRFSGSERRARLDRHLDEAIGSAGAPRRRLRARVRAFASTPRSGTRELFDPARCATQLLRRPARLDCDSPRRTGEPRRALPSARRRLGTRSNMMNESEHVFTERALKQRERILEAARLCFLKRGFHAASIADIAQEADMSPGLMYRYFTNKQAIIKAIIERQLESGRRQLEEIKSPEDLVQGILNAIERWRSGSADQMNAPLFLEISAEATRDPEIAAIVEEADQLIKNHLLEAMQRTAP